MIALDIHKKLIGADGEMNLRLDFNIKKGEFVTLYGDGWLNET